MERLTKIESCTSTTERHGRSIDGDIRPWCAGDGRRAASAARTPYSCSPAAAATWSRPRRRPRHRSSPRRPPPPPYYCQAWGLGLRRWFPTTRPRPWGSAPGRRRRSQGRRGCTWRGRRGGRWAPARGRGNPRRWSWRAWGCRCKAPWSASCRRRRSCASKTTRRRSRSAEHCPWGCARDPSLSSAREKSAIPEEWEEREEAGGERGRGLRLPRRRLAGSGHVWTNGCSGTYGPGIFSWAAEVGGWALAAQRGGVMAGREMGRQASLGRGGAYILRQLWVLMWRHGKHPNALVTARRCLPALAYLHATRLTGRARVRRTSQPNLGVHVRFTWVDGCSDCHEPRKK